MAPGMPDGNISVYSNEVDKATKQGTVFLQQGNLEKAKESFEYAFKTSKGLNEDFTTRACAFNVGAIYVAIHQAKIGLDYLQQAIPPNNHRDGKSNGDLYYNFGLGYESLKHNSEAVKYYELAFEEYQIEQDNIAMEAEVASRAGALYGRLQSPLQSARSFGIAAKTYAQLQDFNQQALCLCQQALQFLKCDRLEEAVQSADDCLVLCHRVQTQHILGKLYNELGLIYTQCHDFNKASTCLEFALPIIRTSSQEKRCEAIILQNLGAVYNSLGDYQRALGFHEQAAAVYAEIGSRACQGQCFLNLAFAYSQLGDTETAGECYLHALQAAKDGGDKRGQWQASEGLGAVYFNQGAVDKAIAYFQLTLKMLADSSQDNHLAQERIVAKLSDALQYQASLKQSAVPVVRKNSRPSTAQSIQSLPLVQTSYRPEIFVRPPTREEQVQMQNIRSHLMLNKVPNQLGHIAHGIGDYNTDDDLSVTSSKRDNKRTSSNRPGSAKPKSRSTRDHPDSRMKSLTGNVGNIVPEAIREEESVPPSTLLSTGRRISKQGYSMAGLDTHDMNLSRRNKKGLLRTGKHDSELEWNENVRDALSDDSLNDEVYSYKERLRPPSTDEEEKDTHTEEETSTVSTSEKQRNQNRVKDILRGGKGLPHSRNQGNASSDSDDGGNHPRRVGLETSKLPGPGKAPPTRGEKRDQESGKATSSSAEGDDDDDDDDDTLVGSSVIESRAESRDDFKEDVYNTQDGAQLMNQYQQRMRKISMREEDGSGSQEDSSLEGEERGDSETVNSEDFNRNGSPAAPVLSPPQTMKFSGTYEEPAPYQPQDSNSSSESESEEEDEQEKKEEKERGGKQDMSKKYSKGNYFSSGSPKVEQSHETDQKGATLKRTVNDPDDPLYQTIRSVKDPDHQVQATVERPPTDSIPGPSGIQQSGAPKLPPRPNQPLKMDQLSRAEQEEYLRKVHQQSQARNSKLDEIVQLPIQSENKKDRKSKGKSEMCLIM